MRHFPPDWKNDRLKDVSAINAVSLPADTDPDYEFDYLEISNVDYHGIVDPNAIERIQYENAPSRARRRVSKNCTVISSVRPNLQAVAFLENGRKDFICSTGFNVVQPAETKLSPKFAYYALISEEARQYFEAAAKGVGYPAVDDKDFQSFAVALPPLPEQQRIAAYLDASCAAIDAAVAAKRRQIEILDALRKTIIHNVITRGVNAELDESRVGWIEKIPHSWKKVKMFRICQKISSGGTPSTFNLDYYGGNIPWVQTGDLTDGYVEVTEKTITELGLQESAARIYPEGTLLMAMYGATIGKLGILKNPSATNQACCAMKFRNDVYNRFIFYLLRDFRPSLIAMSYGGGQPNISQETIKQLYFLLPPFHEQLKISQHLDIKTSAIETIKAGIESQISTLTAYRKSLIHECVTGQRRVTETDVARAQRGREAKRLQNVTC